MDATTGRSRSHLGLSLGMILFQFSLLISPACGDDEKVAEDGSKATEPYIVYVSMDEAYARCGPNGEFYRTDPLHRGQELEVYVETADGWLGIRPPAGSFCWVPASSVQLSGNSDQATVIEDRTVAWIGTHLGRARRYRWQVQLVRGEPVIVLGKSERDGPDGPQLWYRIVPPSGEFRWLHRDQIVETPEELVAKVVETEQDVSVAQVNSYEEESLTPVEEALELAKFAGSSGRTRDKSLSDEELSDAPESKPDRLTHRNQKENRGRNRDRSRADRPIGSGLRDDWQANGNPSSRPNALAEFEPRRYVDTSVMQTESANAIPAETSPGRPPAISFVGSPRVGAIGRTYESSVPSPQEVASDSNWVGGAARSPSPLVPIPNIPADPAVQTVAGELGPIPGAVAQTLHVVDAETVANIERETLGADVEQLQLMLSRLMAAGATAAEAEPIAREADRLARTMQDQLAAGRARAVFDRTRQYQRVASRRDSAGISSLSVPVSQPNSLRTTQDSLMTPQTPGRIDSRAVASPTAGETITETGYLVQVFSARPNSPPFALTDNTGRTLVYVTPAPGTNLRMHLNNTIRVEGLRGYVHGLDTPHILVSQVARAAQ